MPIRRVVGAIQVQPSVDDYPQANLQLSGDRLSGFGIPADKIFLDGRFAWPVVEGHGTVPLAIIPGGSNGPVVLAPNAPLEFIFRTAPNRAVWSELSRWTHLHLVPLWRVRPL